MGKILAFFEPRKKMEEEVLNKLAIQVGWHSFDGILSPGGSINNLYACMIARHRAMPCKFRLKKDLHENVLLDLLARRLCIVSTLRSFHISGSKIDRLVFAIRDDDRKKE